MKNIKIAEYAVCFLFNKNILDLKSKAVEDFFVIYYIDEQDKKIETKVKVYEKNIFWGNLNGRWRNEIEDVKITYEINDNEITITEHYQDEPLIKKFNI